jgi:hemerythrin superfamily protein
MNGIDLLMADHATVNALFAEFTADPNGAVAGHIFDMLTAHDDAEQSALYPLVSRLLGPDAALDALTDHALVKKLIDRARQQEGDALLETMRAIETAVNEHVRVEENDLFPRLREAAVADELERLAARVLQTKQRVG